MSHPASEDPSVPFHLKGAFAPVVEERTEFDLPVIGEIPRELCGTYVRNGPNPKDGASRSWFTGAGMLHGVRLEGGRARWYRNRWIDGEYAPNTNIVRHGGRLLGLVETRLPVEVTPELETVGVYDFDGALAGSMTAHPKLCPRTGELLFFAYGDSAPHLTYYRADASGTVVHRASFTLPAMTFMHDFAITEHYVLFYVLPVLVDFRSPLPFRWVEDFPARFGVLPRDGGAEDMRWFDVAPCTISHTLNAFEEQRSIVLDAVRAPRLMTPHALHRYRFDLQSDRVEESELDARFLDFPRVHPSVVGARHRFAYTIELCDFGPDGGFSRTAAHQHDLETGTSLVHPFEPGEMPGECVIAPKQGSTNEKDAWALLFTHRADGSPSDLVILDATSFSAPPVARVRLPSRVPLGFHGEWFPEPISRDD
jgi:carotenoid cleavage dioxygenase